MKKNKNRKEKTFKTDLVDDQGVYSHKHVTHFHKRAFDFLEFGLPIEQLAQFVPFVGDILQKLKYKWSLVIKSQSVQEMRTIKRHGILSRFTYIANKNRRCIVRYQRFGFFFCDLGIGWKKIGGRLLTEVAKDNGKKGKNVAKRGKQWLEVPEMNENGRKEAYSGGKMAKKRQTVEAKRAEAKNC